MVVLLGCGSCGPAQALRPANPSHAGAVHDSHSPPPAGRRPVRYLTHGQALRLPRLAAAFDAHIRCAELPFPSALFNIYDINDCWGLAWKKPSVDVTVAVGVDPTSRNPVLLYNLVNDPISIVRLSRDATKPHLAFAYPARVKITFTVRHGPVVFDLRTGRQKREEHDRTKDPATGPLIVANCLHPETSIHERPHQMTVACGGDSILELTHIRYDNRTARSEIGQARETYDGCSPDCAEGGLTSRTVRFEFRKPEIRDQQVLFACLVLIDGRDQTYRMLDQPHVSACRNDGHIAGR